MIGLRLPRLEDHALLTARARFLDDVAIADPLPAAFVRRPHPHAMLRAMSTAGAKAVSGVVAGRTLDRFAPAMGWCGMVRAWNCGAALEWWWAFARGDGEVSYV